MSLWIERDHRSLRAMCHVVVVVVVLVVVRVGRNRRHSKVKTSIEWYGTVQLIYVQPRL